LWQVIFYYDFEQILGGIAYNYAYTNKGARKIPGEGIG
jgi:hypothetical protein